MLGQGNFKLHTFSLPLTYPSALLRPDGHRHGVFLAGFDLSLKSEAETDLRTNKRARPDADGLTQQTDT